jgi:subtilisin family serine protease
METYVILRDLNRTTDAILTDLTRQTNDILRTLSTRSPLPTGSTGTSHRSSTSPADFAPESVRTGTARAPQNLPEPKVETAQLNEKDRRDAAADPEIKGFAPVMPTMLLAPVKSAGSLAAQAGLDIDSWGIAAVGAGDCQLTGKGISVAVLDTGIDIGHPTFAGVSLTKRDFTSGVKGGKEIGTHPNWDVDGHGTHCAGTIFGRNVGGTRIGIARGVTEAMIGKVLRDDGSGDTNMLFAGLQWAITAGVDVISMSIGFDFPALQQKLVAKGWFPRQATSYALVAYGDNLRLFDRLMGMVRARAAFDEGTVIVAASGNESRRVADIRIAASLPSAAEDVIAVGAVQRAATRHSVADFSNTLPKLCAPGVSILSAKSGGGLTTMDGTSMACPHVAGVAALWWEHLRAKSADGTARAAEVIAHLTASARQEDVFDDAFSRDDYGAGLVSAPKTAV